MTSAGGDGSAGRMALACSLPPVHRRAARATSGDVHGRAGATGWTSRVHLDVTPATAAVKTGSLPCQPMNEIERTIDVTTDRTHRMIRSRGAVGHRARPRLRPRGRGVRLGLRLDQQGRRQWNVLDDEAGAAARGGDARRLRLDVPAGLRRDGDPGVQDGAAGGHRHLRAVAARARVRPTCRPGSSSGRAPTARSRPRTCPSTRVRSSTSRPSAAPITVSYNLSGGESCSSRRTRSPKIFQGQIKNWDDAAIKADNPERDPAEHGDHRRAPVRRLRDHGELHRST